MQETRKKEKYNVVRWGSRSVLLFFFLCFRVCALDLPILADWLSVSNLNLKSEQRDVSRVAKNSRTQLPTTTKRKRKRKKQSLFGFCLLLLHCLL